MGHHTRQQLGSVIHDDGVDFAVWAPFAKDVTLLVALDFDWKEYPMQADGEGYWHIEDVKASAGQSYQYRITGADGTVVERNDPYARQLTDSDNGLSVIVARDFEWEGTEFFSPADPATSVVYEMHIGTFNRPDAATVGTFQTAIEKLDYLSGLGITHIELMPVTSMAQERGRWGYSVEHHFAVESAYGGRHGLLEFVKACHQRSIAVILDVVYNHLNGINSLWRYDGWYENDRGGIYFYNDERGDTPWGGRPDYGRPEVRQYLLDNVTMWLTEYKVDGLRVDSTIYMRNTEGSNDDHAHDLPDAWSLLAEMTDLAHKINPNAILIAEDNATNDLIVAPTKSGGTGFDAQWEVGFPFVIRDALGITKNQAQGRLQGLVYELSHKFSESPTSRVIYSDSHDTAANGSARLNEVASPGNAGSALSRKMDLLANAIALTVPGIPMLLQGSEFSQNGNFSDWQALDWSKTTQFAGLVLAHEHLINLRKNAYSNTSGLLTGSIDVFHTDIDNAVIAYRRWDKGGPGDDTVIIANMGNSKFDAYSLTLPSPGIWCVRFNSSWKGYSPDFSDTGLQKVETGADGRITIPLTDYNLLVLGLHTGKSSGTS